MSDTCACDMPLFHAWETADFSLVIKKPEHALTGYKDVIVSIVQGSYDVHYHKEDLYIDEENNKIYVTLSQDDSGGFSGNKKADIEINIHYNNGKRRASNWRSVIVKPNLYRRKMV